MRKPKKLKPLHSRPARPIFQSIIHGTAQNDLTLVRARDPGSLHGRFFGAVSATLVAMDFGEMRWDWFGLDADGWLSVTCESFAEALGFTCCYH